MHSVLEDRLAYEILSVVAEIPQGRVASYGQIARLIGRDAQRPLLEAEGVVFRENGCVDMRRCQWDC